MEKVILLFCSRCFWIGQSVRSGDVIIIGTLNVKNSLMLNFNPILTIDLWGYAY